MNDRERHLETFLFGKPDRIPLAPGSGRKSTRARWYREGLPEEVAPNAINEYAYRLAGGTLPMEPGGPGFFIRERMIPEFEEKILEEKGASRIVQDWKGNICEIGSEFDPSYLREASDFVTRRWIKCPVETRGDWKEMQSRYNPDDPSRLPERPELLVSALAQRQYFVSFHFSGPFWQLREWCGFERLSMMFYDEPELVREMVDFWQDYVSRLMKIAFRYCRPDRVHISEDMAYKAHSMLSPEMCREFLLPCWKAWGEIIRGAGVPVYAVDSDGYIGELIPIWMEAGINACDPVEVAAGNDIAVFRRQFGREMAYSGGVDKREMAKGGIHIEQEIKRLQPIIDDGGYIPGCDHGVPADVSWPDYAHYVKLLARATGWL